MIQIHMRGAPWGGGRSRRGGGQGKGPRDVGPGVTGHWAVKDDWLDTVPVYDTEGSAGPAFNVNTVWL